TITARLIEIVTEVRKRFDGILGIHTHNDSDVAVANTLAAVEAGFTHVQGTMNGYGERCGNANLASIIANLELKLGHTAIGRDNVLYKLKQHGLEDRLDGNARRELLDRIKQMEHEGYELEAAEGTFELLVREALRPGLNLFEVVSFEVATKMVAIDDTQSTAT